MIKTINEIEYKFLNLLLINPANLSCLEVTYLLLELLKGFFIIR